MSGKTIKGIEADGGIVIVYYRDKLGPIFLLGQETTYLAESPHVKDFVSSDGENIASAFLCAGAINNRDDLNSARKKFTRICKELENFFILKSISIKHVTFSDLKNSHMRKGYISGKPRYVASSKFKKNKFNFKPKLVERFGFPKGGYISGVDYIKKGNDEMNFEDFSINDTVIRECYEETSIKLDKIKLNDTNKLFISRSRSKYALFTYELSDLEFEAIHKMNLLYNKNNMYENELHNIQFLRIPRSSFKNFFSNSISAEVYEYFMTNIILGNSVKGGTRKFKKTIHNNSRKSKKES